MIIAPFAAGEKKLSRKEIAEDLKSSFKSWTCADGEKCLYLSALSFSYRRYVLWEEVDRVFKRVAMSAGGFSGKGSFASLAYFVAQLKNGRKISCYFKYESDVDKLLKHIEENHPGLPVHSRESQEKLDAAAQKRKELASKEISGTAEKNIELLKESIDFLEEKRVVYKALSYAASKKRAQEQISPAKRALGFAILAISLICIAGGIYCLKFGHGISLYCFLFGGAFLLFMLSGNLLPIGRNSKKHIESDWKEAMDMASDYIKDKKDFPLPPQYAHPAVLTRMIRTIRHGRAETSEEALEVVKSDLKALNSSVKISQDEYREVTAIKPLFLVCNYE